MLYVDIYVDIHLFVSFLTYFKAYRMSGISDPSFDIRANRCQGCWLLRAVKGRTSSVPKEMRRLQRSGQIRTAMLWFGNDKNQIICDR